jgi:hypothetical protein
MTELLQSVMESRFLRLSIRKNKTAPEGAVLMGNKGLIIS